MPNILNQSIGRYHILEQLGEGGMATVYKAFDTRLERYVALKMIRKDAFPVESHTRILKRFEQESRALARLSHPNIVKVYDFGEYEGSPYLIIELITGGTLKEFLGQPIPYDEAAHLLIPISQALGYAHQQGILHRDVKPANILINDKGEPILTDFGIAKLLDQEEGATLTGMGIGVGTPEYMAPEQWLGKTCPASDQYSLGVVFYEMVTGHKPYTAETPIAVLIKQSNDPLPRPRDFIPDLPEEVEQVLFKALAKNPEDRFVNMDAFILTLEQIGDDTPCKPIINEEKIHELDNYATEISEINSSQNISETVDQLISSFQIATKKSNIKPRRRQKAILFSSLTILLLLYVWLFIYKSPKENVPFIIPILSETSAYTINSTNLIESPISLTPSDSSPKPTNSPRSPEHPNSPTPSQSLSSTTNSHLETKSPDSPLPSVTFSNTKDSSRLTDSSEFITPAVSNQRITVYNAPQIIQLTRREKELVRYASYSPDGQLFAVTTSIGIYLYDVETFEIIRFIPVSSIVLSSAFSPVGQMLATGSVDGIIRLWDIESGDMLDTIIGNRGSIKYILFSPDGQILISGSYDALIHWWRVSDGKLLNTSSGYISDSYVFSPDSQYLAAVVHDTIYLLDVNGGVRKAFVDESNINSIAFSPSGEYLASASDDNSIDIWRIDIGKIKTLQGHKNNVNSIAFSPDGSTLASISVDGAIRLWIPGSWQLKKSYPEQEIYYSDLDFSPDGQTILLTSLSEGIIHFLNVSNGMIINTIEGFGSKGRFLLSPDGKTYTLVTQNRGISLRQISDGRLLFLQKSQEEGNITAITPDGKILASVCDEYYFCLWRTSDGELINKFNKYTQVNDLSLSPDGQILASGDKDAIIRLWRVSNGELIRILEGHTGEVYNVTFSPDGNTLFSGDDRHTGRLWRVSDGKLLKFLDPNIYVHQVSFSPDGQMLAINSSTKNYMYRVNDGKLLQTMVSEVESYTLPAFSPDGQILAIGYSDGTVRLWSVTSGKSLFTLKPQTGDIDSVVFTPDGNNLVTLSSDGTIILWGIR